MIQTTATSVQLDKVPQPAIVHRDLNVLTLLTIIDYSLYG
jgi:hypothetical protein